MTKEQRMITALRSVQTIDTLANLIIIEHRQILCEKPFNMATLNQKAKRIAQDAEDIKKILLTLVKVKDEEEAEEHIMEMWRLVKAFSTMEVNQLRDFLDKLEKIPVIEYQETLKVIEDGK